MTQIIEWAKNYFDIDNNTAATITITLSIFILGYLLTAIFAFIKQEIIHWELGRNVISLLKDIYPTVYTQYSYFEKFAESISIDTIGHVLKTVNIYYLKTIHEYSYKQISRAFTSSLFFWKRKNQTQNINHLYKHLNLLLDIENNYKQNIRDFFDTINKYEIVWNENVGNLRRLYDALRLQTEGTKLKDYDETEFVDYILAADKIFYQWEQEKDRLQYSAIKGALLEPLLRLSRESRLNKSRRLLLETFEYILDALNALENMEVRTIAFKETFSSYAESYRKISHALESLSKKL